MKSLHRPDMYGWSRFDEARNVDFHSVLVIRPGGNLAVDPLPLSAHDADHIDALGGVSWIVVTNSDHVRATRELAMRTRAKVAGPAAEAGELELDRELSDGDEILPGVEVIELHGSKTPGELALLVDGSTLITGDLVRSHAGGTLTTLPDAKLRDKVAARRSLARLAALPNVEAVLVGDGWPVFRDGARVLQEMQEELD